MTSWGLYMHAMSRRTRSPDPPPCPRLHPPSCPPHLSNCFRANCRPLIATLLSLGRFRGLMATWEEGIPASCVSDFLRRHVEEAGVVVGWELHNDLDVLGFEKVRATSGSHDGSTHTELLSTQQQQDARSVCIEVRICWLNAFYSAGERRKLRVRRKYGSSPPRNTPRQHPSVNGLWCGDIDSQSQSSTHWLCTYRPPVR